MKRLALFSILGMIWGLPFVDSNCFAQMYTVNVIGSFQPSGLNNLGQVVGNSGGPYDHAFRTAPNSPVDMSNDDLLPHSCTLEEIENYRCVENVWASDINDAGEVVGGLIAQIDDLAFRTKTVPIKYCSSAEQQQGEECTDILVGDSGGATAFGINGSGQTVGYYDANAGLLAFRDAVLNLGSLSGPGSGTTMATDINDSGQAVGFSGGTDYTCFGCSPIFHAFRTAPNSVINPNTDDLGTLGGHNSFAYAINAFGQVVGSSTIAGDAALHAFRTAPNLPINSSADDLGTLGGSSSSAWALDGFGQVLGWSLTTGDTAQHAFLFSNGVMHDLNSLIPTDSGCVLIGAGGLSNIGGGRVPRGGGINNRGQIVVSSSCGAVRLDPIYKAHVQPPIDRDGRSVFSAKRGVIPVRFLVTKDGRRLSCELPASISVTKAGNATLTPIDESALPEGADFRITGCEYHYNLHAASLGVGTYRVDININGVMVGHAVFALK